MPTRLSSLRVATTLPMTRASCMGSFVHFDRIDDSDDGGVDRAILHPRRHSCGAAADDENGFADAGVDRINRHDVIAFGLAARVDRARDEKLGADEPRI